MDSLDWQPQWTWWNIRQRSFKTGGLVQGWWYGPGNCGPKWQVSSSHRMVAQNTFVYLLFWGDSTKGKWPLGKTEIRQSYESTLVFVNHSVSTKVGWGGFRCKLLVQWTLVSMNARATPKNDMYLELCTSTKDVPVCTPVFLCIKHQISTDADKNVGLLFVPHR